MQAMISILDTEFAESVNCAKQMVDGKLSVFGVEGLRVVITISSETTQKASLPTPKRLRLEKFAGGTGTEPAASSASPTNNMKLLDFKPTCNPFLVRLIKPFVLFF